MNESNPGLVGLFNSESSQIPLSEFVLTLLLAAVMSSLLGFFYMRYGNSLSNRKALAGTLILICVTTMIIITIVKSSLALSLGLVGALSIVRFRTAIKDPEELSYFFIAIAIGLGLGAGQLLITIIGAVFLFIVVFLRKFFNTQEVIQNLSLVIHKSKKDIDFEKVVNTIKGFSTQLELRRLDEIDESIEISLFVRFSSFEQLLASKKAIQDIDDGIQFSYLEIL